MTKLGRLERLTNLRDFWKTEDRDFTPWLSLEENIAVLSETLHIDLEVEAVEKSVGPFRADILCKDTATGELVLIENQLERTDHRHLGQLMTYAAGLKTATIIWIAAKFDDEHRAALDWLNEKTEDSLKFFGLEIELWRIDNGPAAPNFDVISKPNEWTRSVGQARQKMTTQDLSETKEWQLAFWNFFHQFALSESNIIRPQKPYPQHWMNFSLGKGGCLLGALLNFREDKVGVELYLGDDNANYYFDELYKLRDEIEADLGVELDWRSLPERKACRIIYYLPNAQPSSEVQWERNSQWLLRYLEAFHSAFSKRLKTMNPVI